MAGPYGFFFPQQLYISLCPLLNGAAVAAHMLFLSSCICTPLFPPSGVDPSRSAAAGCGAADVLLGEPPSGVRSRLAAAAALEVTSRLMEGSASRVSVAVKSAGSGRVAGGQASTSSGQQAGRPATSTPTYPPTHRPMPTHPSAPSLTGVPPGACGGPPRDRRQPGSCNSNTTGPWGGGQGSVLGCRKLSSAAVQPAFQQQQTRGRIKASASRRSTH